MFFKKYHIVIFKKGSTDAGRKIHMRGWLISLSLFAIFLLIGSNVWLLTRYIESMHTSEGLSHTQKDLEEQSSQLLNLLTDVDAIDKDLRRIERFDSKLRFMMNVEDDSSEFVDEQQRGDVPMAYGLLVHSPTLIIRKLQTFITHLAEDVYREEVRQQELLLTLRENSDKLLATPSIWPVIGFISSSFGFRTAPFTGKRSFHKGLDISNRIGTPVVATARGKVIRSGYDGAYGLCVEIEHGGGIVTKYAHLQRSTVKVGQWVNRGESIGAIGMTGRTTGPHLHYEVIVGGTPVNPMRYIVN